jgi:succinate dehydrogenase flavin-adding protein (antitoxin of CptAB toxin-antitoxin module)
MLELDELLTRYLDTRFATAPAVDQQAFCRLLALADEELIDYLLGAKASSDSQLAHVIREIHLRTACR